MFLVLLVFEAAINIGIATRLLEDTIELLLLLAVPVAVVVLVVVTELGRVATVVVGVVVTLFDRQPLLF